MRLPRALMLAVMLTAGITAVMAYSQAGASQPALGAVVATDEALLALACADDNGPAGESGTEPLCRMEDGRLVLDFTRHETVVPGEPGGYDLGELEVGTQYGSPAPSNHWYAYVKYEGTYHFTSEPLHNAAQSHNHDVLVTDYGLDEAEPNCVWIEWHQPDPQNRTGQVKICLPPLPGGEDETIYGFQPGADYELGDVFTVTNNSNARYTVTMAAEGSLDHADLDVTLSSGGTTFHPSGDEVTLDPGETISVTVSFSVDEDWSEGSTTLVGRFVVTAEVVDAP